MGNKAHLMIRPEILSPESHSLGRDATVSKGSFIRMCPWESEVGWITSSREEVLLTHCDVVGGVLEETQLFPALWLWPVAAIMVGSIL